MSLILAIETTEKHGSVALLDGRQVLADVRLPQDRRSAQTLTVAMDAILREQSVAPEKIELVAVVLGPGSFTGLRVGVMAAKMFAESANTLSLWCMGINQRSKGVWANNLIHNLHLITGSQC